MPRIFLCVNQEENLIPYKFSVTGVEVYTFEEAEYHVYKSWKESAADLVSKEFVLWVMDVLGQSLLASEITELEKIESPSDRILKFLSLTNFYNTKELTLLKHEVNIWESQLEWERYLSMGDELMQKKEPAKALYCYKSALEGGKNLKLLNNIGICLMRLRFFKEAAIYLFAACEMDKNSFDILINYAEALILGGEFEQAFKYLKKAERAGERAEVDYLYGLLAMESGNITEAINHYERAAKLEYDPFYCYAAAKGYIKQRKFNKALETLENIKAKDREFYINQAAAYEGLGDNTAAIKCIEKAIFYGGRDNSSELWILLSKYRRQNHELDKADRAAATALFSSKGNKLTLLEDARVKKAQGKYKDYQKSLVSIIEILKREYRDKLDIEIIVKSTNP